MPASRRRVTSVNPLMPGQHAVERDRVVPTVTSAFQANRPRIACIHLETALLQLRADLSRGYVIVFDDEYAGHCGMAMGKVTG